MIKNRPVSSLSFSAVGTPALKSKECTVGWDRRGYHCGLKKGGKAGRENGGDILIKMVKEGPLQR